MTKPVCWAGHSQNKGGPDTISDFSELLSGGEERRLERNVINDKVDIC